MFGRNFEFTDNNKNNSHALEFLLFFALYFSKFSNKCLTSLKLRSWVKGLVYGFLGWVQRGPLSFGHTHSIVDPNLIFSIRFTKPPWSSTVPPSLFSPVKRFCESDTKDQLWINNRVCVAEALRRQPPMKGGCNVCFAPKQKHKVNET